MTTLSQKPLTLFLSAALLLTIIAMPRQTHAMDPRAKAVLTMAAYGTAGGALLGTASLAFGAKGRAVAIGASLGLYAGLIFGTYIVVNHRMQHYRYDENYYPDTDTFSPYESGSGWGDWFGGSYWSPHVNLRLADLEGDSSRRLDAWSGIDVEGPPPVYFTLWQYQF